MEAKICKIRRRPMAAWWWAGFRYAGARSVECGGDVSRVDLVGVEVVNKVLRQEHVLAVKVTKGVLWGRAWPYLRERSFSFT
jgi:hypothetical protein